MVCSNRCLVSIVIPIRNESKYIEGCLRAILAQDYSGEKEIIVVDGMSTDDTWERICSLVASVSGLRSLVTILDNPGQIVPTGLNTAILQAKGEIIIRMDGHTVVAPDYVRQCVETLQRTHADNVGGRMNAMGTTHFGKAVAHATSTPFGIGGGRFHYSEQEEWVDTVYLGAWPRSVFEKIGLFDEELVRDQDDEFNYRLRAAGGRIYLNPEIKSEYNVRRTPKALCQQYYQYGYWKVRVLQKHPRQMSLRQFIPPAFVIGLLLSFLLSFIPLFRPLAFFIPSLYIFANLTASIITTAKKGWQYLPLLPLTYVILHLSYGCGFLVGLVRFANRWKDRRGRVPELPGEIPA